MSYGKTLKLFSADGRIYQVEYAFKAVNTFGMTSIAIKGKDSVVVCTQKKVPDKLIVPSSITSIFNITECIGAIVVGNLNDARTMVTQMRHQAADFTNKFGYEIPVSVLAARLGGFQQRNSQSVTCRPFCVSFTLVGCDEEQGPSVYKVDPAGGVVGFKATATGSKEQEANTQLEKHLRKTEEANWSSKETVQLAIQTLQTVISSDFKANEIEIGMSTVENPSFKKLTEAEIDAHLTELADKL